MDLLLLNSQIRTFKKLLLLDFFFSSSQLLCIFILFDTDFKHALECQVGSKVEISVFSLINRFSLQLSVCCCFVAWLDVLLMQVLLVDHRVLNLNGMRKV